jgi:hypothetical protein
MVLVAFAGRSVVTRSVWYAGGEDIGDAHKRAHEGAAIGTGPSLQGGSSSMFEGDDEEDDMDQDEEDDLMDTNTSSSGSGNNRGIEAGPGVGANNSSVAVHTCGHAVHSACLSRYMESLRQRRSHVVHGASFEDANKIDMDKGEYLCPICRRVANLSLPVQRVCGSLPALMHNASQTRGAVSHKKAGDKPPSLLLLRPALKLSAWQMPTVCLSAGRYQNSMTREAWTAIGACIGGWGHGLAAAGAHACHFLSLLRDQLVFEEVCGRFGGRGFGQQTLALLACLRHHALAALADAPLPASAAQLSESHRKVCAATAWEWLAEQCPQTYSPSKATTPESTVQGANFKQKTSQQVTDAKEACAGAAIATDMHAKVSSGGESAVARPLCRHRAWTAALSGDFTTILTTDLLTLACAILLREPQNGRDGVTELVSVLYAAQIAQVCVALLGLLKKGETQSIAYQAHVNFLVMATNQNHNVTVRMSYIHILHILCGTSVHAHICIKQSHLVGGTVYSRTSLQVWHALGTVCMHLAMPGSCRPLYVRMHAAHRDLIGPQTRINKHTCKRNMTRLSVQALLTMHADATQVQHQVQHHRLAHVDVSDGQSTASRPGGHQTFCIRNVCARIDVLSGERCTDWNDAACRILAGGGSPQGSVAEESGVACAVAHLCLPFLRCLYMLLAGRQASACALCLRLSPRRVCACISTNTDMRNITRAQLCCSFSAVLLLLPALPLHIMCMYTTRDS